MIAVLGSPNGRDVLKDVQYNATTDTDTQEKKYRKRPRCNPMTTAEDTIAPRSPREREKVSLSWIHPRGMLQPGVKTVVTMGGLRYWFHVAFKDDSLFL